MPSFTWDHALGLFAPSTVTVTNRDDVAGGSSPKWGKSDTGKVVLVGDGVPAGSPPPSTGGFDVAFVVESSWTSSVTGDLWWPWDGTIDQYVIGINLDNDYLNNPSGKYQLFLTQVTNQILGPLAYSGDLPDPTGGSPHDFSASGIGENDRTSLPSFLAAADLWYDLDAWISSRAGEVKAMLNTLDSEGDWSGAAAAAYKTVLLKMRAEMFTLQHSMNTSAVVNSLETSGVAIERAVNQLMSAYQTWRSNDMSGPARVYQLTLDAAMLQPGSDLLSHRADHKHIDINIPYFGSPDNASFWDAVETHAKASWVETLTRVLDPVANDNIVNLSTVYGDATANFGTTADTISAVTAPAMGPSDANANPNIPDLANLGKSVEGLNHNMASLGDGLNGLGGNLHDGLNGLGGNLHDGLNGLGGNLHDGLGLLGSNFAGLGNNLSQGLAGLGNDLGGGLGGLGGFSTQGQSLIGADGSPILGSDGKPVTVPTGSRILSNGAVVDANGRPVLGPNGRPLTAPPGSHLVNTQAVVGPDGKPVLRQDHTQLTVPSGSTINQDGTITGPDGKLILGNNGKPVTVPAGSHMQPVAGQGLGPGTPLVVPPGSTVSADGTVLGPSGHPILGPDGQPIQVPAGTTVSADGSVLGLDGKPVTGGLPPLFSPPATTSQSVVLPGGLRIGPGGLVGGGSGVSASAPLGGLAGADGLPLLSRGSAPVASAATAAEEAFARTPSSLSLSAAEEAAAEQAAMLGRAGTQSGTPFMPPMTGGPGGAFGGAPQKRRTWLEEDEEVWGTESTASPSVIGRPG